ncbi:MAG: NHL repeat-containing protein [Acidimicrobiia bacterium]
MTGRSLATAALCASLGLAGCSGGEEPGAAHGGADGDGGPAVEADLANPEALAVGDSGHLYIADSSDNRVRVIDPEGTIDTLAGSGRRGFSGDGGPATRARLFRPDGVAADRQGNVYVADFGNHRVRRVDSAGIITTAVGIGTRGFSGDGGEATQAQIADPGALAVDRAGNLYIADLGNGRVRKVDPEGIITTVAGTGVTGFSGDGGPATAAQLAVPRGLAVDPTGNLYIADLRNHRVRRIDSAGVITTVVGTGMNGDYGDGGPALEAALADPTGLAVDSAGRLFVADAGSHRIRRIDAQGVMTTVAGTGTPGPSRSGGRAVEEKLRLPGAVAAGEDGVIYLTSSLVLVLRVDRDGTLTRIASA